MQSPLTNTCINNSFYTSVTKHHSKKNKHVQCSPQTQTQKGINLQPASSEEEHCCEPIKEKIHKKRTLKKDVD